MTLSAIDKNFIWHVDAIEAIRVLSAKRTLRVDEYDAVRVLRAYVAQYEVEYPNPTTITITPRDFKVR